MRKLFLFGLLFTFISIGPSANAGNLVPPPTDVSCEYTATGLRCSNGIVITGDWTVAGEISTQWNIWKLKTGASPELISNYENQKVVNTYSYTTGIIDITYDYLLSYLSGDANGTILVGATLIQQVSGSTLSNPNGRRVYIMMNELKLGMDKAKADADAKAKADADAKAKADADAKAKAALDAANKSAESADKRIVELQEISDIKSALLVKAVGIKSNLLTQFNDLNKFYKKNRLPFTNLLIVQSSLDKQFEIFLVRIKTLDSKNSTLLAELNLYAKESLIKLEKLRTAYSIKCTMGAKTLTVTATNAVCPKGYKRTNS